jgi:hypothetical protein
VGCEHQAHKAGKAPWGTQQGFSDDLSLPPAAKGKVLLAAHPALLIYQIKDAGKQAVLFCFVSNDLGLFPEILPRLCSGNNKSSTMVKVKCLHTQIQLSVLETLKILGFFSISF